MASKQERRAQRRTEYWKANVRLVASLLCVWFLVSFAAGILFVEALDCIQIPGTGFRLGFFMAQQGSIIVFVLLIFIYVLAMKRLDRKFHAHEAFEDQGKGI